jgi:hypothetical protein
MGSCTSLPENLPVSIWHKHAGVAKTYLLQVCSGVAVVEGLLEVEGAPIERVDGKCAARRESEGEDEM